MTKTILVEGEGYYGHASAECFTCGGSNGVILEQIGGSDYDRDAMTQSEMSFLLGVAKQHERKNPSHIVRVYEFRRRV